MKTTEDLECMMNEFTRIASARNSPQDGLYAIAAAILALAIQWGRINDTADKKE